jgi:hypothetical protein
MSDGRQWSNIQDSNDYYLPNAHPGIVPQHGLGGLGADIDLSSIFKSNASGDATGAPAALDPATVAMINSEGVFATNLYRQTQGLPPITGPAAAPAVNVGISPDLQSTLMMAAAGLGLFYLIGKRM